MNREIKFRGQHSESKEWLYGSHYDDGGEDYILPNNLASALDYEDYQINQNTICQFTGLYDKKGTPIYEGDIVEFYEMKTYCINPDCEHHLIGYNDRLYKRTCVVEFKECSFGVDGDYFFVRLSDCGFLEEDIEELKDREKNDAYFDTNGYEIDNSIVGIKVIGNIHDNPELLK